MKVASLKHSEKYSLQDVEHLWYGYFSYLSLCSVSRKCAHDDDQGFHRKMPTVEVVTASISINMHKFQPFLMGCLKIVTISAYLEKTIWNLRVLSASKFHCPPKRSTNALRDTPFVMNASTNFKVCIPVLPYTLLSIRNTDRLFQYEINDNFNSFQLLQEDAIHVEKIGQPTKTYQYVIAWLNQC